MPRANVVFGFQGPCRARFHTDFRWRLFIFFSVLQTPVRLSVSFSTNERVDNRRGGNALRLFRRTVVYTKGYRTAAARLNRWFYAGGLCRYSASVYCFRRGLGIFFHDLVFFFNLPTTLVILTRPRKHGQHSVCPSRMLHVYCALSHVTRVL